jgi:hypothetical protein
MYTALESTVRNGAETIKSDSANFGSLILNSNFKENVTVRGVSPTHGSLTSKMTTFALSSAVNSTVRSTFLGNSLLALIDGFEGCAQSVTVTVALTSFTLPLMPSLLV